MDAPFIWLNTILLMFLGYGIGAMHSKLNSLNWILGL